MKKQEDYSPNYLENIASAYVLYKDWELAKDIARIRTSSVRNNGSIEEIKDINYDSE